MSLSTQCPITPNDPFSDALIAPLTTILLLTLYHYVDWAGALTTLLASFCGSVFILILSKLRNNR